MPAALGGQWTGRVQGEFEGLAVLDLDDVGTHHEGHAFIFPDNPDVPGTFAYLKTANLEREQRFAVTDIGYLYPGRTEVIPFQSLGEKFPGLAFARRADVVLQLRARSLKIDLVTDTGSTRQAILSPSAADRPSMLKPRRSVRSWRAFKDYATSLQPNRFMFRGQDVTNRLRTTFHRSRRKDLIQFINVDIPYAHRVLTARTEHLFNLTDPLQNGAFWNLVQHHGFPTPLLDWTHSPFVAAFFAYRANKAKGEDSAKVRIFVFDRAAWTGDYGQLQSVAMAQPHFSILEAFTIENKRALPQQALSSVTNVDDIESYIARRSRENGKQYLQAIDLPANERRVVMQELSLMGITAGSLFPGLDGACEELRGRFFSPVR